MEDYEVFTVCLNFPAFQVVNLKDGVILPKVYPTKEEAEQAIKDKYRIINDKLPF